VHNYIGGVGPLDPGPYGYMTNFLSPVDPIFFLHHANMDRLWDVWTRKQQRLKLPWLPDDADLKTFSLEPFLFYVDGKGQFVPSATAGDYVDMTKFAYDYEPGFGEDVISPQIPNAITSVKPLTQGVIKGLAASLVLPDALVRRHLTAPAGDVLFARIIVSSPSDIAAGREFDVAVGAPSDLQHVDPTSPYYAGTISFFGKMKNMSGMQHEMAFTVPLPKAPQAFHAMAAGVNDSFNIRLLPAQGVSGQAPALRGVTVLGR
jgi:tyrosinase